MKAATYIYRISTSAKPEVHAVPGAQIATFVHQSRIRFAW